MKYLIEIPDGIVPDGYKPVAFMPPENEQEFRGIQGFTSKALCDISEPFLIIEKNEPL